MSLMLTRRGSAALLLAGLAAGAAPTALAQPRAGAARTKFDADRRAILAMAGDYHVRFDFRETVSFRDDYDPIDPKVSGGNEIVRVIEDAGDVIRLQHILCMEHEGRTFTIKHWRQDWTFEPRTVLAYASASQWRLENVARENRDGAWSQTVWQTDDSPRYGGVGVWRHDNGVSAWTSEPTLRPLARRDAIRHPPYSYYRGTNRHALTPTGWVHEQDNAKIGLVNGVASTFVHETVINTYDRATDFPIAAGDAYWTATAAYWAAVRSAWDAAARAGNGMHVEEEAENGSVTGPRLMDLADKIKSGETTTEAAIAEARTVIATATASSSRQS